MRIFITTLFLTCVYTAALAQQAPLNVQTLKPVGSISGNFECFNDRQLRVSMEQEGKDLQSKSTAQNGEVVELWQDQKGNFQVIFSFPGMAATCVMVKGQFNQVK